jgi:2'-5' RNA ligase
LIAVMPRLFTAIEIPAAIGQSLAMLRGGLPGAHWIEPESYHVTLRFIGDVDGVMAREIAVLLGQVRRAPFEITLDGVEAFGGRKPRLVYAAVKPIPALTELQAEHERLCRRLGLEAERKFTPHVTLARLRQTSSRQVAEYLAPRADFRAGPFPVTRFVLLSSRDSVGGGPYVSEAVYPLSDTP